MLSVIVLHISYIIYHTKYRMQGRALPSRAWTKAIKNDHFPPLTELTTIQM